MHTQQTILVVDDNPVMLKFLYNLLSEKYNVVSHTDAYEAFRWLEDGNHPAVIISDLMSPGLDNIFFVKNLRISGFYRKTPIVLLSSMIQSGQIYEELSSIADAYFSKPFSPVSLKDTIVNLMASDTYNATA